MEKETMLSSLDAPPCCVRERPFRRWNGRYQKEFYDVRTPGGRVFLNCWPNAGMMNTTDGTDKHWKYRENGQLEIRLAANPLF